MKFSKKIISSVLSVMLTVAMVFTMTGCSTKTENGDSQSATGNENRVVQTENILGEGRTVFLFTVVDKDGNEEVFEVHTDKETVGEALVELGLIEGEEGAYGLYVKTVNGITADYDVDGTYWAFYVNGEYATSGVDTTSVEEAAAYSFKVEK